MRFQILDLDRRFRELKQCSEDLLARTGDSRLYFLKTNEGHLRNTIGDRILRSAGTVEQMSGGLTRRLWDDPFEWTLPERFPQVANVLEYLQEVEVARRTAFEYLASDDDLAKTLPAPVEIKTISEILLTTLDKAELHYSKAESILNSIEDATN